MSEIVINDGEDVQEIKVRYRGIEVIYDEQRDKWKAAIDDSWFERTGLSEAKKKIDDFFRAEHEIEREFVLYYCGRWNRENYEVVEITSIQDGGKSAWITRSKQERGRGKTREKVDMERLFRDCPENRGAVERIRQINDRTEALHNEAKEIAESMIKFNPTFKVGK
ncbi:MAG TPA: hypothetical protein PKM65_20565 [Spirochaetota bacterium]|nr:hypothetical protein [Spirochaetota bacterium]